MPPSSWRAFLGAGLWLTALAAIDGDQRQLPCARLRGTRPRPWLECRQNAGAGRARQGGRLSLRGGNSVRELVVPDTYDKIGKVLAVFEADAAAEGLVTFRAGNHSIGTEELSNMGVALRRDAFRLRVQGEAGTTLAGCWRLAGGGGEISKVRLLDVALLRDRNYDGEFLHPGIMYGDCCIAVTGSRPWHFRDCEVQCSGTALRAYEDADVTCERLVTGGDNISKLPPSNIFDMDMKPWVKQLLLEGLNIRNKTTGLPLYQESSMPRYQDSCRGRLLDCCMPRTLALPPRHKLGPLPLPGVHQHSALARTPAPDAAPNLGHV